MTIRCLNDNRPYIKNKKMNFTFTLCVGMDRFQGDKHST